MKGTTAGERARAAYGPLLKKTPEAALKLFFEKQFPQYGELAREAVVRELMKLLEEFYPSNQHLKMGQIMWPVVDENETHGYGKSIEKCKLRPVFLDLITKSDIEQLVRGVKKKELKKGTEVRLFNQSKQQGGVMSCVDAATIMHLSPSTISRHIREYEKENEVIVPRRGTVHDMGPSVTHKRQICYKIIVEGKTVEQVARETNHSPEAITRYVKDYKRISACLAAGLTVENTAFVTKVSKRLIYEYAALIEEHNIDIGDEDIPF